MINEFIVEVKSSVILGTVSEVECIPVFAFSLVLWFIAWLINTWKVSVFMKKRLGKPMHQFSLPLSLSSYFIAIISFNYSYKDVSRYLTFIC